MLPEATMHPKIVQMEITIETLRNVAATMAQDMKRGLEFDYASRDAPKVEHPPLMMLPSFVSRLPTGEERGTFLAVDLGGTNLRVCAISLLDPTEEPHENLDHFHEKDRNLYVTQGNSHRCVQAHYQIPGAVKTGSCPLLFAFIATCVRSFLKEYHPPSAAQLKEYDSIAPIKPAPFVPPRFASSNLQTLGFTFSFPVQQFSVTSSSLLTWTKGFQIPDAVNEDVAAHLQKALDELKLNIKVKALINDTVGTLMAHAYDNPKTVIGVILGTGTNAAYVEDMKNITKLNGEGKMVINTEWGAFDSKCRVLPETSVDKKLDLSSLNPGQQRFEKMISGMYLGEIVRLYLIEHIESKKLFEGVLTQAFSKPYSFITKNMQVIESFQNQEEKQQCIRELFSHFGYVDLKNSDFETICCCIRLVRRRAARLAAAGMYAILSKCNLPRDRVAIAVDGTLWLRYPEFKRSLLEVLGELLGEKMDLVSLENAHDGSGMGAAVVAALYS